MNIGAGIFLIGVTLFLFFIAILIRKRQKKLSAVLLSICSVFFVVSALLISGVYDPYENHIQNR